MSPTVLHICLFIVVFCVLRHLYRNRQASKCTLPPGPPSNWIVGNILKVSPQGAWEDFARYKDQFGELVFFHGLGNRVLVLNSMAVITDFLDKRANIYSNRPAFTVVGELMGLGQSMPLLPYGKEWREHRKLAHIVLSPASVKQYWGVQEDMAALFGKLLLDNPKDFFSHMRLTAGRIILAITYGLSVGDVDSFYIKHAEETMKLIGKASVPGAYVCDLLPFLKYLPSWVPFQKEAKRGKDMIEALVTMPFEHVKRDMQSGTAGPSLTEQLLGSDTTEKARFEHRIKWATGSLYGAGGETTYATVLTFMMAMALHPELQRKAQAEVDLVVNPERLPSIADKPKLPYVNAVIKETMRWHPALPLSIARQSSQDDFYEGYFVPKDTIVIPNVWAVAFEPSQKYDSQSFIPERFLDPNEPVIDPEMWAFGFGRRICPGKYLGENSVFILIAIILSSFTISPPLEGEIVPRFGKNLVSYPEPFSAQIVPRSKSKAALIHKRAAEINEGKVGDR